MPDSLDFELVTSEQRLLALEPEWRQLFEAAGRPSPFIDFDWVLMCWRQLAADGRNLPVVAIVRERGRLVLALALQRERKGSFYRYAGAHTSLPTYDWPLVSPQGDPALWLNKVVEMVRRDWRCFGILLNRVREDAPIVPVLSAYPHVRHNPRAVVELEGGFAAYMATFSAMSRQQVRRYQRRLIPGGNVPLRLSTAATYDADLDWLLLQKRAWTPPGSDTLHDWLVRSDYEQGLRDLCRRWIEDGRAQLGFIEADGRRVAGALSFVAGTDVIYYLITYDPQFATVSPGRMLTLKLIEHAAAKGCELFDFMGGQWEWKERLQTNVLVELAVDLGAPRWLHLVRRVVSSHKNLPR